jgi:hypothetical protein
MVSPSLTSTRCTRWRSIDQQGLKQLRVWLTQTYQVKMGYSAYLVLY